MSQEEQKVIDFVIHLPTDPNPYEAAAAMLRNLTKSPQSPQWSRVLKIITLIIFGVMFAQSCFLIYQRLRLKRSCSLTFNKLGLVVINMSDMSASAYCLYASLSIILLSYQIAIDHGYSGESLVIVLFGLKFIPIFASAWAFLWVCCCQCVLLSWESNLVTHFNPAILQPTIKWGMSLFFLIATFGSISCVAWPYIVAFKDSRQIYALIDHVQATLLSGARTYNPEDFQRTNLLKLLIPMRHLITYQANLERHILFGIRVYGLALMLLVFSYVPCLVFCLRGLYRRSVSQRALDAAVGPRGSLKPSPLSRKYHQERRRLLYHSLIVYCSAAAHLPIIVWQLFNSHHGFTRNSHWKETTYHGLAVPFSITGNIILFILNVHSRNIRHEMRERAPSVHGGLSSGSKPQKCCLRDPGSRGQVAEVKLGDVYSGSRLCSLLFTLQPTDQANAKSNGRNSTISAYVEPNPSEASSKESTTRETSRQIDLFTN